MMSINNSSTIPSESSLQLYFPSQFCSEFETNNKDLDLIEIFTQKQSYLEKAEPSYFIPAQKSEITGKKDSANKLFDQTKSSILNHNHTYQNQTNENALLWISIYLLCGLIFFLLLGYSSQFLITKSSKRDKVSVKKKITSSQFSDSETDLESSKESKECKNIQSNLSPSKTNFFKMISSMGSSTADSSCEISPFSLQEQNKNLIQSESNKRSLKVSKINHNAIILRLSKKARSTSRESNIREQIPKFKKSISKQQLKIHISNSINQNLLKQEGLFYNEDDLKQNLNYEGSSDDYEEEKIFLAQTIRK